MCGVVSPVVESDKEGVTGPFLEIQWESQPPPNSDATGTRLETLSGDTEYSPSQTQQGRITSLRLDAFSVFQLEHHLSSNLPRHTKGCGHTTPMRNNSQSQRWELGLETRGKLLAASLLDGRLQPVGFSFNPTFRRGRARSTSRVGCTPGGGVSQGTQNQFFYTPNKHTSCLGQSKK